MHDDKTEPPAACQGFQCADGTCLDDASLSCDGRADCPDFSDETNCPPDSGSSSGMLRARVAFLCCLVFFIIYLLDLATTSGCAQLLLPRVYHLSFFFFLLLIDLLPALTNTKCLFKIHFISPIVFLLTSPPRLLCVDRRQNSPFSQTRVLSDGNVAARQKKKTGKSVSPVNHLFD